MYYGEPGVEIYGGDYTEVLAPYINDHDIYVTAF